MKCGNADDVTSNPHKRNTILRVRSEMEPLHAHQASAAMSSAPDAEPGLRSPLPYSTLPGIRCSTIDPWQLHLRFRISSGRARTIASLPHATHVNRIIFMPPYSQPRARRL